MPTPNNDAATFRINRVRKSIEYASVAHYSMSLVFGTPEQAQFFVKHFTIAFNTGATSWYDDQPAGLGKSETAVYYEIPEKIADARGSRVRATITDVASRQTADINLEEIDGKSITAANRRKA